MGLALNHAMREILAGWPADLDPAWRAVVGGVEPGYDRDRSGTDARGLGAGVSGPARPDLSRRAEGRPHLPRLRRYRARRRARRHPRPGSLSLRRLRHRPRLRGRQCRALAGTREDVLEERPHLHAARSPPREPAMPATSARRRLGAADRRHRVRTASTSSRRRRSPTAGYGRASFSSTRRSR